MSTLTATSIRRILEWCTAGEGYTSSTIVTGLGAFLSAYPQTAGSRYSLSSFKYLALGRSVNPSAS